MPKNEELKELIFTAHEATNQVAYWLLAHGKPMDNVKKSLTYLAFSWQDGDDL